MRFQETTRADTNYSITAITRPAPVLVTSPSFRSGRMTVGKLVFTRHNPGLRRDGAPWADTHIRSGPGTSTAAPTRAPASRPGWAYLRWHHECGKAKRMVAGESEAWFNPRRALTVAGPSGRCGIGVRRWIEPLADLSRVSVAQGWCRPSRICCPPATVSCWMASDTPRRFAETVCEGLRQGTSGAGWTTSPRSGNGTSI